MRGAGSIALRVMVCIAAGAVVSVGVAWWRAVEEQRRWPIFVAAGPMITEPRVWPVSPARWPGGRPTADVPEQASSFYVCTYGWGTATTVHYGFDRRRDMWVLNEVSSGWPCVGFAWYDVDLWPAGSGAARFSREHDFEEFWLNGWRVGEVANSALSVAKTPIYLPLAPIWTGMAVNVGVYGGVVGGVWLVVSKVRGRRAPGTCAGCGYPRGAVVCPECGREAEVGGRTG